MDLELAITELVDQTISAADRAALELRLAQDPAARQTLAEHQKLVACFEQARTSLPPVRWDRLGARISMAVAEAEAPQRSYRIGPRWAPAALALAASVVLAFGIAFHWYAGMHAWRTGSSVVAIKPPPAAVLIVVGPHADGAASQGVVEVAVGPAKDAESDGVARYSDELASRPSRVVMASAATPLADPAPQLPY